MTGGFVGDNYKCRGNYIFWVSGALSAVVEEGVVANLEVMKKIEEFKKHDWKYTHDKFTTQEEIDLINETLDLVIKNLESKV